MPAIRFTALALACVLLVGCSQIFKPRVTQQATADDQGRPVVAYTNCDPTRVVAGGEECYTETHSEKYCYRTLSDVECYSEPKPGRTPSITEVTEE